MGKFADRFPATANQAPSTVSLADAPAKLREIKEHMRGLLWIPPSMLDHPAIEADMATLEALASSLEQQTPVARLTEEECRALTCALQLMGDRVGAVAISGLLQRLQSTNTCSNEDTVTITLSREDAELVANALSDDCLWLKRAAPDSGKVQETISRLKPIIDATRAALQPPTPERRE
jgi:hypothetical protein